VGKRVKSPETFQTYTLTFHSAVSLETEGGRKGEGHVQQLHKCMAIHMYKYMNMYITTFL